VDNKILNAEEEVTVAKFEALFRYLIGWIAEKQKHLPRYFVSRSKFETNTPKYEAGTPLTPFLSLTTVKTYERKTSGGMPHMQAEKKTTCKI
jgi:hypothetical protein